MTTKWWDKILHAHQRAGLTIGLLLGVLCFTWAKPVSAQLTMSDSHNVTINAVVPGEAPSTPAIINSPTNGLHVTTTPLVISGTCKPGLMVKVFNNQALAGIGHCESDGTFVINIGLLPGENVLTVLQYDGFDRPGPASSSVTVLVDKQQAIINAQNGQITIANASTEQTGEDSINPTLDAQKLAAANPVSSIARILGIGQVTGPVSVPEEVMYTTTIVALGFFLADLLLFQASIATTVVGYARTVFFWLLRK